MITDQYVGDTVALQSLIPALFLKHMETFVQASGQRLKLRNSALVPIGYTAQLRPFPAEEVAGLRVVPAAAFRNEPQTEPSGDWQGLKEWPGPFAS